MNILKITHLFKESEGCSTQDERDGFIEDLNKNGFYTMIIITK